MRKFLCCLLSFALLITVVPVPVFANDTVLAASITLSENEIWLVSGGRETANFIYPIISPDLTTDKSVSWSTENIDKVMLLFTGSGRQCLIPIQI